MKVGTHNGPFHADDAFACAMLSILHDGRIEIVRTRDPEVLKNCDALVDVGGVHEPWNGRFDHHQKGGAGERDNGVPYSSAGLVWKHLWHDTIGGSMKGGHAHLPFGTKVVAERVDRDLIQSIDAADCGHKLFKGGVEQAPGIRSCSVSAIIAGLNPTWVEVDEEASGYDLNLYDLNFGEAVVWAEKILRRAIQSAIAVELSWNEFLEACRGDWRGDNPVVVLDRQIPWGRGGEVPADKLYVVFPDPNDVWMVQCVPTTQGSFDKRKALPFEWAALRGDDLAAVTGVEDAVFCHGGRFIGGAGSREGAVQMANLAVAHKPTAEEPAA